MSFLTHATTVNVSVTVLAVPSCVINGHRTIEVDFGEVLTASVNGDNYIQKVNYTLDCSNLQTNALQMKIQGNATSFDASALQTNIDDFGVALRTNGQPLNINSWLKFTYSANQAPLLEAVPIKKRARRYPVVLSRLVRPCWWLINEEDGDEKVWLGLPYLGSDRGARSVGSGKYEFQRNAERRCPL